MADEDQDESRNQIVFISKDEAWSIISNQIEVQEQLRTRGYQVLSIFIAVLVVITGLSLSSFEFEISESGFQTTLSWMWFSESELGIFLGYHIVIAALLIALSFLLILSFIARNYLASRHSSLKPGLGRKDDSSMFHIITEDTHEFLSENQAVTHQYDEWITSNAKTLQKKRHQLNTANDNLTLVILSLLVALSLLLHSMYVNVVLLIVVDLVLFTVIGSSLIVILKTRDEWWNLWSWPFTEQQKENFPYMDTAEFHAISFFSTCILAVVLIVFWLLVSSYIN